jgi:GT2 family glycosyltransferase
LPPSYLRVQRGFLKKRNLSYSFRMPFFSVIIPTYNRLPYLIEALESVRQQSFTDYEVIIVDDGSTDDTARVVERMAEDGLAVEQQKSGAEEVERIIAESEGRMAEDGAEAAAQPMADGRQMKAAGEELNAESLLNDPPSITAKPRLRVIRQANAGPGAARNLGARNAKGEYLAFLDSDDIWFPWTLEVCYQVIMKSKFPSIVSAKLVEFSQKVELGAISKGGVEFESFADYLQSAAGGFYVGAGMLFIKKLCFDGSGGFTENRINLEDHDLVLKCGDSSGFAAITSPATLAWRRHQGSLTKIDKKSIEGSNFIIRQEKHGNYPGGSARKKQRIQIICSHVRAVSMGALAAGHSKAGWSLFWKCLAWNVLLRRWKYVFGFPIKALLN